MEEKRRSKRPKPMEEGVWDCSVCTYRNSAEAFKCDMCDVRKGTSTRKPRLNPSLVAQQVAQQFVPPPVVQKDKKDKKDKPLGKNSATTSHRKGPRVPRIKNIDRSTAHSMEVTVGSVTVIITDYKLKKERTSSASEHRERERAMAGEDSDVSLNAESNSNSVDSSRNEGQMMDDEQSLDNTDIELDMKQS